MKRIRDIKPAHPIVPVSRRDKGSPQQKREPPPEQQRDRRPDPDDDPDRPTIDEYA